LKRTVTLQAPAKINLGLQVLRKRPDGYHDIDTVFQAVALCDRLTFLPQKNRFTFQASGVPVPRGDDNLILKAARLLKETAGLPGAGAKIRLQKNIPTGAGLGGGSSDAAATLKALNALWGLKWPARKLESLAARLGSDVPFFIRGGTARGRGRGEKLTRLPTLSKIWVVLCWPGFPVATAWAYKSLRRGRGLSKANPHARLFIQALEKRGFDPVFQRLSNDFEKAVFRRHPRLGKIKRSLLREGARAALMSGSGSMVFGLADSKKMAERLAKKVRPLAPKTWVTYTL